MEFEAIKDLIPYYLTRPQAEGLMEELEKYNEKTNLYTSTHRDQFLQGDGWRGFQLFDFYSGTRTNTRGILISNSCDVDPANKRRLPSMLTFVPLIRLTKLESLLRDKGVDEKTLSNMISSIMKQESTQFFFLPGQAPLDDNYVAWLSNMHSMPVNSIVQSETKEKLFTLNMTGFYLFILKLSIHFCRLHENVDRSVETY
jgi:hypothetical protein